MLPVWLRNSRQEQEHSMHIERMRKGLEQQIKVRTEIHLILYS